MDGGAASVLGGIGDVCAATHTALACCAGQFSAGLTPGCVVCRPGVWPQRSLVDSPRQPESDRSIELDAMGVVRLYAGDGSRTQAAGRSVGIAHGALVCGQHICRPRTEYALRGPGAGALHAGLAAGEGLASGHRAGRSGGGWGGNADTAAGCPDSVARVADDAADRARRFYLSRERGLFTGPGTRAGGADHTQLFWARAGAALGPMAACGASLSGCGDVDPGRGRAVACARRPTSPPLGLVCDCYLWLVGEPGCLWIAARVADARIAVV